MNPRSVIKAALAALLIVAGVGASQARRSHFLVVHEWGTFTSIAGKDGGALEWRPLAETADSDLPEFVYDLGELEQGLGLREVPNVKAAIPGLVRMETPVIYFYTSDATNVRVTVNFPNGTITEWYPRARSVGRRIEWGEVRLLPNDNTTLSREDKPNHYYAAREVDAAMVRVCSHGNPRRAEFEKFLFYRGVGQFEPPVRARLNGKSLELSGSVSGGQVIVYEKLNDQVGFAVHPWRKEGITVSRPELTATAVEVEPVLHQMLVAQGLFEKEATAMIDTWRDDWFRDGLRVLYIVPRPLTDEYLPLQLEPRPTELVRVLVGRVEVITKERVAEVTQHLPTKSESNDRFACAILENFGDVDSAKVQ